MSSGGTQLIYFLVNGVDTVNFYNVNAGTAAAVAATSATRLMHLNKRDVFRMEAHVNNPMTASFSTAPPPQIVIELLAVG